MAVFIDLLPFDYSPLTSVKLSCSSEVILSQLHSICNIMCLKEKNLSLTALLILVIMEGLVSMLKTISFAVVNLDGMESYVIKKLLSAHWILVVATESVRTNKMDSLANATLDGQVFIITFLGFASRYSEKSFLLIFRFDF